MSFLFIFVVFSESGYAKISKKSVVKPAPATKIAPTIELNFLPENRIKIDGDSTMRKYSAEAKVFEISAQAKEVPELNSGLPWTPIILVMKLEVKNLKSGEGLLDDHMHENLKADKHPSIEVKLEAFNFTKNTVTAFGTLKVAGVEKPIELKSEILIDGSTLKIKGKKLVLMTDYGIEPPTMMMGTLKTDNQIEISFDVNILINTKQKG